MAQRGNHGWSPQGAAQEAVVRFQEREASHCEGEGNPQGKKAEEESAQLWQPRTGAAIGTAQGLDPEGSQGIHSCPQELVYPEGGNQSNMVGNP